MYVGGVSELEIRAGPVVLCLATSPSSNNLEKVYWQKFGYC